MPDLHKIRLPAGWYPDPSGADHRRWWDGTTWTQHTAPFQRPVQVYDVVDHVETKATAGDPGAGESPVAAAPRRIRTAARLGRGLAALAHKLPFGLPAADAADDDTGAGGVAGAPPAPPTAPGRVAAKKPAPAPRAKAEPKPKVKAEPKPRVKAEPKPRAEASPKTRPTAKPKTPNGRHVR